MRRGRDRSDRRLLRAAVFAHDVREYALLTSLSRDGRVRARRNPVNNECPHGAPRDAKNEQSRSTFTQSRQSPCRTLWTFLTGNVGGDVKWYASNGRWGLRGDYRFTAVRDKDDAPSFFGRDTRYGHRVYGGLIVNVVR